MGFRFNVVFNFDYNRKCSEKLNQTLSIYEKGFSEVFLIFYEYVTEKYVRSPQGSFPGLSFSRLYRISQRFIVDLTSHFYKTDRNLANSFDFNIIFIINTGL